MSKAISATSPPFRPPAPRGRNNRPALPGQRLSQPQGAGRANGHGQRSDLCGLSSRQPWSRTTGRNRQINIKATEDTIGELYRIVDDLNLPLGRSS